MLARVSPTIPSSFRLLLAILVTVGLAHAWACRLTLDGTPREGVLGTSQDVDYFRI